MKILPRLDSARSATSYTISSPQASDIRNHWRFLLRCRYLHSHYAYYIREMKIKAYAQLLESYRSLTLEYMAEAFGVTEDYMDGELSRFALILNWLSFQLLILRPTASIQSSTNCETFHLKSDPSLRNEIISWVFFPYYRFIADGRLHCRIDKVKPFSATDS